MGPIFYLQLGSIPAIVVSSPETAKEVLKTLDAYCCNRPSSPASRVSLWFDKLIGLEARYKRIFRDLDAFFETVLRQHSDQERVLPEKDNLVDVLISIWKGQGCIYRRHSDRLSDIALGNV
nr:unnamed protein product [Digitaria exilis]